MTTVTMYRGNKLDQAESLDADQLAADFIATIRGEKNPEYKSSGRLNLEFEYRWFLSSPELGGFTWKNEDGATLWAALNFQLDAMDADGYSEFLRLLGLTPSSPSSSQSTKGGQQ